MGRPITPLHRKVFRGVLVADEGCWTHPGSPSAKYVQVRHDGRLQLVHRLAYELLVGPIPAGLTIDHLCGNRRCVRPDHLEPVSLQENVKRSGNEIANNASKHKCPHGHPYDAANTYVTAEGFRQCRACKAQQKRERR